MVLIGKLDSNNKLVDIINIKYPSLTPVSIILSTLVT